MVSSAHIFQERKGLIHGASEEISVLPYSQVGRPCMECLRCSPGPSEFKGLWTPLKGDTFCAKNETMNKNPSFLALTKPRAHTHIAAMITVSVDSTLLLPTPPWLNGLGKENEGRWGSKAARKDSTCLQSRVYQTCVMCCPSTGLCHTTRGGEHQVYGPFKAQEVFWCGPAKAIRGRTQSSG